MGLAMTTQTKIVAGAGCRKLSRALLISTALATVAGAQLTRAQDRQSLGATTVTPDKAPREVDTPTANTGSVGLTEVVVTARRRAENLQTTPVSETAISGAAAEQLNVRDFQNLRGLVPDLEVTPQANGGAALTIRGIGQTNDQVNADAKTGFYVNEMYVARQEGNSLYFYDVNSLQVLKGPQGTLFGKNTTGGAILLTNASPGPDFGGYVQARVGNLSRIDTEGAINVPLSDTLTSRFSFRTDSADGYIKHVLDNGASNDIDDKSYRGQLRWTPNSKLTVDALGEHNQSNTDGSTEVVTGCNDNAYAPTNYQALHGQSYCATYPGLPQKTGDNLVYGGATLSIPTSSLMTPIATGGDYNSGLTRHGHPGPFNNTEVTTFNVRVNYALTDDISLKSITGYRRSHSAFYNPTENAPNDLYAEYDATTTNQITEEDNITGRALGGKLNYVAGFFYYSQQTTFVQDTGPDWDGDPVGYLYDATNNFKSYAGYIQASYKVTPALEITLGGRYTYDDKSAVSSLFFQQSYGGVCADTPAQTAQSPNGDPYGFLAPFIAGAAACGGYVKGAAEKTWDRFNPRVQMSYQVTPDIYIYGSVTTGYNAGGFNQQLGQDLGGGLISYNPEKLTDYEAGLKTEWLDRRLRFNVTGFYQKYSDIQTNVEVTYNHVPTRAIQTGASEHEEGVEAELEYEPMRDLFLRANMSYLQQAYDSVAPSITQFNINSPVSTAPKYTYALDGAYTFRLEQGYVITPDLNWRAVGAKAGCVPIGACSLPAYGLLGARVDFKLKADSPWVASLWGTNLNNAKVVLDEMLASQTEFGIGAFLPGRPREYGVEFTRKF